MTYTAKLETIPGGAPGLALKARRMRSMVESAKRDPRFRARVAALLQDLPEKDHQGEIRRLIDFVRTNVRYMRDPWSPGGLELFTDPRTLLRDVGRGTASGDCDDHVILASALLETAGYETRYPVGAAGPEDYRHIWIEVLNPSAGWISADLTTKEQEIGWDPGPDYHHVEIHDGKGAPPMLGHYHAPRALPPSFQNAYAEPGVYVGSTPSDFFRAVAIRGQLPERNAWAVLGAGHDPGQLGGWFSDVADKWKGYVQDYGPTAAGIATTVFAGPAAGGAVFGVTSALAAEKPEVEQVPSAPAPQPRLIGDAGISAMGSAALRAMGITDAQIDQAVLTAKGIDPQPQQYSAPVGPSPAPASSGVLDPSPRPLGPGQVETSPWETMGPGPGAGGFNPLWLALGAAALFLLRKR